MTKSRSSQEYFFENYALVQLAEWVIQEERLTSWRIGSKLLLTSIIDKLVDQEAAAGVRQKDKLRTYWTRKLRAGRRWKTLVDQHGLGILLIHIQDLKFRK